MEGRRDPTIDTASVRPTPWAAYAVCAWALGFAVVSFFWAAGGTLGVHTIAAQPEKLASPRALWIIGLMKLLPGLLALALVLPWGRVLPHGVLRVVAMTVGGLLILYGGANLVDHGLMAADVTHTPAVLGRTAVRWHLLLWDPWWVLGGLLMIATARSVNARTER